MANTPTREHREAATTLIRFVASAWIEDPTATYGLATPELELLRKVSHLLADAEQRGFDRGREAGAAPFAALFEAGYVLDTTMPTEADGYVTRSLHVGLKTGRGGTWLDAARYLCAKLGLDLAKGGE